MPPVTLIPLTLADHTDLLQAVYDATPGYWALYDHSAAPELQALHDLREAGETPGRTLMGILLPLNLTPSPSPLGEGNKADLTPSPSPKGEGSKADLTPSPSPERERSKADLTPSPSPERERSKADLTPNPSPEGGGSEVHVSRLTSQTPTTEMIGVIDFRLHYPENGVTTIGMIMVAQPWQRQGHASAALALLEAWFASSAGMTKVRAGVEQFNLGALRFFQHNGFDMTSDATRTQVGERLVRLLYLEKNLGIQ